MPKKKKVSIYEKRRWLEEYEGGMSVLAIASRHKRDTRTVTKSLEDARRERDAQFARAELMKEALRNHQSALKQEMERIMRALETPLIDFAPLSWHEGDNSIFRVDRQSNEIFTIPGISLDVGRPSKENTTILDLFRQHFKNDRLWKLLVQWEKAYVAHATDRLAIQKKTVYLLEQKTGYKLIDRTDISPPFLYSYTAGSIVYEAALELALGTRQKYDLDHDITADTQTATVKHRSSILAEAPGGEEKCRDDILNAYKKLLISPEFDHIKNSYENLNECAGKAKQAAEEIALLGYIPGQCQVCQRLGM